MDILGEDASVSGGASIVMVYRFLNVWEVYFAARPCARPFVGAARSCFSGTGRPFCIVPEDVERLRRFLHDTWRPCDAGEPEEVIEADLVGYVGRLLRAAPEPAVMLALPFGVSNTAIRSWVRQGLLEQLVELHLMGHGGPSDAGLANIVTHCTKLRHLTVLCSSVTAAAALALNAHVKGQLGSAWWKGVRFSRLCVLPRLQCAPQKSLTLQRVPPWLCGEWTPFTPVWGFEVQHYDPLGRCVFLRNGGVERVGVVRSCVPSPFGPWWEVDLCFFARQAWFEQLMLVMPTSGPCGLGGDAQAAGADSWRTGGEGPAAETPSWVSLALQVEGGARPPLAHFGTMRSAVMGPSENVRHRPRQFPRHGRRAGEWMRVDRGDRIQGIYPWTDREWAEAALLSSAEGQDATLIFDHAESSEEESHELLHMPSVEELLEQLDRDEQPSRRAEEGSAMPSMEEIMAQLDVEEERDRLV